jgi:CrcB protein
MRALLLVAIGGALGSMARYKLSGWVLHHATNWRFPISTFLVNVSGCLIAGVLAGMSAKHNVFSPDARLLLFTGLLGGFTTFSAFGLEAVLLMKRGEWTVALGNVGLSVAVGLLALWAGFAVAEARS